MKFETLRLMAQDTLTGTKNRHRCLQRSIPWRTPTNEFAREKTPGQPWEIFPTPGMAMQSISDPTW